MRINIKGTTSYSGVQLEAGTYSPRGTVFPLLNPEDYYVFELLRGSINSTNFEFVSTLCRGNYYIELKGYASNGETVELCYTDDNNDSGYSYGSITTYEDIFISSDLYRTITNEAGDKVTLNRIDGIAIYSSRANVGSKGSSDSILYCNGTTGILAALRYSGNFVFWRPDFSKSITLTEGYNYESDEIKRWLLANTNLSTILQK